MGRTCGLRKGDTSDSCCVWSFAWLDDGSVVLRALPCLLKESVDLLIAGHFTH